MPRSKLLMQVVGLVCLMSLLLAASAAADERGQKAPQFMRFVEDGENGGTLDAEIVTYRNADDGTTVDLVGAVHIADAEYFAELNERFTHYDSVLYEMVKPAGSGVPMPGVQSDSAVSGLQRMLKNLLELDFQLDAVDYTPANFVHADLTAEEFAQLQKDRGESLMALMLRALMNDMSRPRGGNGAVQPPTVQDLLTAAAAPDRARQFKLLLAPQFQDMEAMVAGFGDAEGESVIITERNKVAMKALEQQLAAGDRNIAIFYGAAHLPDMEERLAEMGYERVSSEWLTAWDMRQEESDHKPDNTPVEPEEVETEAPKFERI